jgi:hypothetical protein
VTRPCQWLWSRVDASGILGPGADVEERTAGRSHDGDYAQIASGLAAALHPSAGFNSP